MTQKLSIVKLGLLVLTCLVIPIIANTTTATHKVIVYSFGLGKSHAQFDCTLAKWAKDAGFEVDALYIAPRQFGNAPFCPEAVTKEYRIWMPEMDPKAMFSKITYGKANMLTSGFMDFFQKFLTTVNSAVLNDREIFDAIKARKYDIGISEMCGYIPLTYLYKVGVRSHISAIAIPLGGFTTITLGLPNTPSFTTEVTEPVPMDVSSKLSEKLHNLYIAYLLHFSNNAALEKELNLVRTAFNDSSITDEILNRYISLTLVNTPLLLNENRPTTQAVLHVGDAIVRPPNPLTGKLATLLETTTKKVIFISFGTFIINDHFPKNFGTALLGAFEALPEYDFIWKAPKSEDPGLPNVHVFEWVDQVSLLAHKKLVVFGTHCGQNSVNEAVVNGVPILGIPVWGDQQYNCKVATDRGLGLQVDLLTLTKEELVVSIKTVIEDPTYASNAELLARKIQKQPLKPKEVFQGWLWYLAEFGDMKELQLASISMSFLEYYSLDIIIPSIILIVISLVAISVVGLSIVRSVRKYTGTISKPKLS